MTNFESAVRKDFIKKGKEELKVECNYQKINGSSKQSSPPNPVTRLDGHIRIFGHGS